MSRSRGGKSTPVREAQEGKRPPGRVAPGLLRAPPPAEKSGATARERASEAAGLDTVREILFGASLRALQAELARQEDRLLTAIQELRDDLRRHHEALEVYAKRELDNLGRRLAAETSARAEGVQGVLRELRKAIAASEKHDSQLEDLQADASRELRGQLLAQGSDLLARQRQWRDEILAALADGLAGVRATETDRTTLANLLSEMSSRLASGSPSASTVH